MEKDFRDYLSKYAKEFDIPPAHAIKHLIVREYGKCKGLTDAEMDNIAIKLETESDYAK